MTEKAQIYLAGAIEKAPDGGVGWRKTVRPILEKKGFKVFDPCIETDGALAKHLGWDEFNITKWRELREEDPEKCAEAADWIVEQDLNAVLQSDILLIYCNQYGIKSAGTLGEATVAKTEGIPVVLLLDRGISEPDLPLWLLGCSYNIVHYNPYKSLVNQVEEYFHNASPDKWRWQPLKRYLRAKIKRPEGLEQTN